MRRSRDTNNNPEVFIFISYCTASPSCVIESIFSRVVTSVLTRIHDIVLATKAFVVAE